MKEVVYMATNIVIEDNLKKVTVHSTIRKYDEERPDDILAMIDTDIVVIFEDKDGTYPDGKVISSKTKETLYTYDYGKDADGNITGCTVGTKHIKNGYSNDYEKTTTKIWYDKDGRVSKQEWYTRNNICYRREQFWYYLNGSVMRKKVKGMQTITTCEYRPDGKLGLVWTETLKSKATNLKYKATFDSKGEIIHYKDFDKNTEVFVEKDLDHDGNKLSETKIFRHISDNKIFARKTICYEPYTGEYKISKVIDNGFVTSQRWYDLNGEMIKMFQREGDAEVMTRFQKTVDEETGEVTKETHMYITDKDGYQRTKYIKDVYDADGKLLVYSEDNSKVTTYEYDDEGRRTKAITKQLVNEEFIVIDEIEFAYFTDEETGEEKRTRTETRFDRNGKVTCKQSHVESVTVKKKEYTHETREYKTE